MRNEGGDIIIRTGAAMSRSLSSAVISTANSTNVELHQYLVNLAHGLRKNVGNKRDITEAHRDVAAKMRESVRMSFTASGQTTAGRYREGGAGDYNNRTRGGFQSRYSGGALRRAITAPTLAVGSADGIAFVDEGRLTKEAAHWARINFGAKGTVVGDRHRASYPIRFDGRQLFRVGFDRGSRPAFGIPEGHWRSGGEYVGASPGRRGRDQFFLGRNSNRNGPTGRLRPTRGIQGREFLDAGFKRMATELPTAYRDLMDMWWRKSNVKWPSGPPGR